MRRTSRLLPAAQGVQNVEKSSDVQPLWAGCRDQHELQRNFVDLLALRLGWQLAKEHPVVACELSHVPKSVPVGSVGYCAL